MILFTGPYPERISLPIWAFKKQADFLRLFCLLLQISLMKLFMLSLLINPNTASVERAFSVFLSTKLRNGSRGAFKTLPNFLNWEQFAKIVYDWMPSTTSGKRYIFDVWQGSKCTSGFGLKLTWQSIWLVLLGYHIENVGWNCEATLE